MIIKTIRDIIDKEPLRVDIYNDEIIFYIWEIEVPIIFDRNSFDVSYKPEYLPDYNSNCNFNLEMLLEMCKVIKAIETNINEIKDW